MLVDGTRYTQFVFEDLVDMVSNTLSWPLPSLPAHGCVFGCCLSGLMCCVCDTICDT